MIKKKSLQNWQNGTLYKKTEINTLSKSLVIYQAESATKSGRLLIIVVDVGYNGEGRNIEHR